MRAYCCYRVRAQHFSKIHVFQNYNLVFAWSWCMFTMATIVFKSFYRYQHDMLIYWYAEAAFLFKWIYLEDCFFDTDLLLSKWANLNTFKWSLSKMCDKMNIGWYLPIRCLYQPQKSSIGHTMWWTHFLSDKSFSQSSLLSALLWVCWGKHGASPSP